VPFPQPAAQELLLKHPSIATRQGSLDFLKPGLTPESMLMREAKIMGKTLKWAYKPRGLGSLLVRLPTLLP